MEPAFRKLADAAVGPRASVHRALRRPFWRRVEEGRAFIRESERWSRTRLAEYQLERLRELLDHAYTHVPLYRRRFDEAGARPGDVTSLEEFARLPLLEKADLQDRGEELLATDVAPRDRMYVTTAGSTGIPVGFYLDRQATDAWNWAFMLEQWSRVGFRVGDRIASLRGAVIPRGRLFARGGSLASPLRDTLVMSSYHLTEELLPAYGERLREFKPDFIHAYPSAATLVARYLLESGEAAPEGIKAILCGSENLYDWQRSQLEEAFGCRVYSWYGQSESVALAGECEHDTRLHVFPQYGVTELVDDEGRQVTEPGMLGEIVATGFLCRSMPLIRYRTMDVAAFAAGLCELCGRPYPRLERIEGRLQEFVVSGTGRQISMAAINMHSPVFDNVHQFRFVQETAGHVLLRVVPKAAYDVTADTERIKRELAPKLGPDLQLVVETVSEIPTAGRGKFRFLEQKLETALGDR